MLKIGERHGLDTEGHSHKEADVYSDGEKYIYIPNPEFKADDNGILHKTEVN